MKPSTTSEGADLPSVSIYSPTIFPHPLGSTRTHWRLILEIYVYICKGTTKETLLGLLDLLSSFALLSTAQ